MANDCLFCKMAQGEIKPDVLYEDDHVLAFRDINPQAPVHFLVIPKEHITTLNDVTPQQAELIGRMYLAAQKVATDEGIADSGYRSLINCNADAGQSVWHVHLHVLGGRTMAWPPG
ncbi:MAG: histidine triad nucleotide-binding protein [Acidiferrobacteraceae bacterium]|jgi:histidine triad (HIT) family protein